MKILHLAHNHPAFHAGGTEIFAKELSGGLDQVEGVTSHFLAAALKQHRTPHPGTSFVAEPDHAADFVISGGHFTPFSLSQSDTFGFLNEFGRLLTDLKPDVVHFHHVLLFGLEAFAVVKNSVPDAKVIMTLHDYYLICANEGLMLTSQGKIAESTSPTYWQREFPKESVVNLALREQSIRTALKAVDEFVSPSAFLKSVFVDWGIPAEKIRVIHNGYPVSTVTPALPEAVEPSYDFGFFGHLNEPKGVQVFLKAMELALAQTDQHLTAAVYGSDRFAPEDHKETISEYRTKLNENVSFFGDYQRQDVIRLMQGVRWVIIPSIWWENDPLTVQEAKIARRPILCSDIGGMAERVLPGQDGFHFPCGNAGALAKLLIEVASGVRDLNKTSDNSTSMPDCLNAYMEVYRDVLNDRP